MGRRKKPETLDEMRAEVARLEKEKMQTANRLKQKQNALRREERNARTRRLIHEGAYLESLVPEFKIMSQEETDALIRIAVTSSEVMEYLHSWQEEHNEKEIRPDTGIN